MLLRIFLREVSIFTIFSICLLLVGCQKFVQVSAPTDRLVSSSVFNNSQTATAAQLNVYSQMYMQSYNISQALGLLSDELSNYSGTSVSNSLYYTNSMNSISNLGPWADAFNYIYQENAIIEGLNGESTVDFRIKNQLVGEARFLRAFWYFYLINMYGDVPLITSTDYHTNARSFRMKKIDIYSQIVEDLKLSGSLLTEKYVDRSDTLVSIEKVRPNVFASTALLSRVYLYQGKFDSAFIEANKVIESGMYHLESNLDNIFLSTSKEAIWQLATPQPTGLSTYDAQMYVLIGEPNNVAINKSLIHGFEMGDLRRQRWIGSFVAPSSSDTFYYPLKYKIRDQVSNEYVTVLRLSEIFLIRGEAKLEKGNSLGAIDDLNLVRNRAGLPNYNGSSDKVSLKNAFLHERQVELFAEWGHRWFDIVRTNAVDSILGAPRNVSAIKGGVWDIDGHQKLFPIWKSEIALNPNLIQNPGY